MSAPPLRLILASASPRRLSLLGSVGIVPDAVLPADIDETPLKGELPRPYAARVALAKSLIDKLDQPPAAGPNGAAGNIYVVYLKKTSTL